MLIALSYKTKQFLVVLIKLSIVVGAFYFIFNKLFKNESLPFHDFSRYLIENKVFTIKNSVFLVVLTGFNWLFEILKWQKLMSSIKTISFKNAAIQTLGSLTASLFTPNRIGEYGAKTIYYTKEYRKRVMLINLISNMLQMSVTAILGVFGIYFFLVKYPMTLNFSRILGTLIIGALIITLIIYFFSKTKFGVKRFSLKKILTFIKNYPKKTITYGFCFSLLRYLIFSFQFYYLLTLFGIELSYFQAMVTITSMYFLASVIPAISFLDVVVKGSIAVFLFSFVGVNMLSILSIVTIMWLFNFVFPSILGSYFVLNFKFPKD